MAKQKPHKKLKHTAAQPLNFPKKVPDERKTERTKIDYFAMAVFFFDILFILIGHPDFRMLSQNLLKKTGPVIGLLSVILVCFESRNNLLFRDKEYKRNIRKSAGLFLLFASAYNFTAPIEKKLVYLFNNLILIIFCILLLRSNFRAAKVSAHKKHAATRANTLAKRVVKSQRATLAPLERLGVSVLLFDFIFIILSFPLMPFFSRNLFKIMGYFIWIIFLVCFVYECNKNLLGNAHRNRADMKTVQILLIIATTVNLSMSIDKIRIHIYNYLIVITYFFIIFILNFHPVKIRGPQRKSAKV